MSTVVWLESAVDDLHAIATFIAEINPLAAQQLVDRLIEDAENLAVFKTRYRRGRVAGTHELVSTPNYILVYRDTLTSVEILNVIHARQQYP